MFSEKALLEKLARYQHTLLFDDSLWPNFCIHTWRKNHVLRATACVLFTVLRGFWLEKDPRREPDASPAVSLECLSNTILLSAFRTPGSAKS